MSDPQLIMPLAVPVGMVRWFGGPHAPSDWNGGHVLLRCGRFIVPYGFGDPHSSVLWQRDGDGDDIVAYTPLVRHNGGELSDADDQR